MCMVSDELTTNFGISFRKFYFQLTFSLVECFFSPLCYSLSLRCYCSWIARHRRSYIHVCVLNYTTGGLLVPLSVARVEIGKCIRKYSRFFSGEWKNAENERSNEKEGESKSKWEAKKTHHLFRCCTRRQKLDDVSILLVFFVLFLCTFGVCFFCFERV